MDRASSENHEKRGEEEEEGKKSSTTHTRAVFSRSVRLSAALPPILFLFFYDVPQFCRYIICIARRTVLKSHVAVSTHHTTPHHTEQIKHRNSNNNNITSTSTIALANLVFGFFFSLLLSCDIFNLKAAAATAAYLSAFFKLTRFFSPFSFYYFIFLRFDYYYLCVCTMRIRCLHLSISHLPVVISAIRLRSLHRRGRPFDRSFVRRHIIKL